mgnify:CR=1 FL=1
MSDPIWILMPILGAREYTRAAISDSLSQTLPTRLLLINQGVEEGFREELEGIAEENQDRVFVWSHVPPLPSLSATWNRGLRCCWEAGAEEVLVVNNDVRLAPTTLECLSRVRHHESSYFVTAVGVAADQYQPTAHPDNYDPHFWASAFHDGPMYGKGGPDFSCFLISREGHEAYPFDEAFTPAYCEDLDLHRRFLLGGDGDTIFSVNLPYLHYASGTRKTATEAKRQQLDRAVDRGSRAYYARKWGGPVNQERYTIPFDPGSDRDGVTTPELQAHGGLKA